MFGSLGGPELLLILVIALIVFGPRKLPEIGKSLGKMLVEFRRASNEFKRTIEDEVEAEKLREQVQSSVTAAPASEPAALPPAPQDPSTPALGFAHDDQSPAATAAEAPAGTVHAGAEPH